MTGSTGLSSVSGASSKAAAVKRSQNMMPDEDIARTKKRTVFHCSTCNKNFGTSEQADKHKQSKLHKRNLRKQNNTRNEAVQERLAAAAEHCIASMGLSSPGSVLEEDQAFLHLIVGPGSGRTEAQEPNLFCKTCDKRFMSSNQARRHMKTKSHQKAERALRRIDSETLCL